MNIRQIKLALTVDLLNLHTPANVLLHARETMNQFSQAAGRYTGLTEKASYSYRQGLEKKVVALQYEHCTLDLELLNEAENRQTIQGFDLKFHD